MVKVMEKYFYLGIGLQIYSQWLNEKNNNVEGS